MRFSRLRWNQIKLLQPTFVLDYHIEISPLAKPHRRILGVLIKWSTSTEESCTDMICQGCCCCRLRRLTVRPRNNHVIPCINITSQQCRGGQSEFPVQKMLQGSSSILCSLLAFQMLLQL